jgi:hypothetical protein
VKDTTGYHCAHAHHISMVAFGNVTTRHIFSWDSGIDGGWMGVVKGERELYNATPEAADFAMDLMMRNYMEQQAIVDGVLQLGGFEAPARPLVHQVFLIVRKSRAGAHMFAVNPIRRELYGTSSEPY